MKKAVAGCLAVALVTGSLSVPGFTMEVHAEESTVAIADAELENKGWVDVENKDSEKKSEDAVNEKKEVESEEKDGVEKENIEKAEQGEKNSIRVTSLIRKRRKRQSRKIRRRAVFLKIRLQV